ncbi:hypothetical protein ACOALA_02725 [Alicyclobacillus acidoterrestris]|uniref:hypothetical protein n=1 Tax=Alicyclobacillus acidoterrestris TaxID=1450 RepID=UPI003F531864
MRKFVVGMTLISLLLSGCGQTIDRNDGGTTTVTHMPVTNVDTETHSFTVPNDTEIKSMTASASILPGSKKKTFTDATDKGSIDQVLTWLKNSKEVGLEKSPIGKGGYPPTLQIVLNNGNTMVIGPAVDWSSKKLANGNTETSGKNAVGYVAMATTNGQSSKVVRLYSPDLYRWIVNHQWE